MNSHDPRALAEALLLVQNDNRSGLAPLKPGKNTMTEEELWWQDYMNQWMRQFNGFGGRNMDFMPAPANDAALRLPYEVAALKKDGAL